MDLLRVQRPVERIWKSSSAVEEALVSMQFVVAK